MDALAVDADGNCLLSVRPADESDLGRLTDSGSLRLALVIVWYGGQVLLVRDRRRDQWELPGGMIEAGETATAAASRELAEETGLTGTGLQLAGLAEFGLADGRREHAAIYATVVTAPGLDAFTPNAEIEQLRWWDGAQPIHPGSLDLTIVQIIGATTSRPD